MVAMRTVRVVGRALAVVALIYCVAQSSAARSGERPRWESSRLPRFRATYSPEVTEGLVAGIKVLSPKSMTESLSPKQLDDLCRCSVWLIQDHLSSDKWRALEPFAVDVVAKLSLEACGAMMGIVALP